MRIRDYFKGLVEAREMELSRYRISARRKINR